MDKGFLKISEVASGALQERFQDDLKNVLRNIADPNTDPKKARKIQINIKVIPNGKSGIASLEFGTKTTLMAAEGFSTEIVFEQCQDGMIAVSEFGKGTIPGQMNISNYENVVDGVDQETGEIVESGKIRRIGGVK